MVYDLNELPQGVTAVSDKSYELPEGVFIVKHENEPRWRICHDKSLNQPFGRYYSTTHITEEEAIEHYNSGNRD